MVPISEQSLTLPVKHLVKRSPVFIDTNATASEAAAIMHKFGIGSVLVKANPPGIVTDRDLRGRVLAVGLSPQTPITDVMSRPLKTLDSDAPLFAALQLMLEENIHHLALVEEGKIVGLISGTDLLQHQASNPLHLREILDASDDPSRLSHYSRDVAAAVQTLFRGGLGAVQIGQIVSNLNDALVKRLVKAAQRSLGTPPTPFSWVVFGSEGRFEQTLLTDQDNALVYEKESNGAHHYFAALAKRVVDGLIQVGFPPCPGGYMATNWCKPLNEWRRLYLRWVQAPEPQALLDAAIFFDFRAVAGELSLASVQEVVTSAQTEKLFIAHMARDALGFVPPLNFFNRIRSDGGMIDLKKGGILPIVGLARVGALAAGSRERSTLERLVVAGDAGFLYGREDASLMAETFEFLSQLRLRHQLAALQSGRPLDHRVSLDSLSALERRRLREGLLTVRQIQDTVRATLHLDRMA